jgi:hypothetical protein
MIFDLDASLTATQDRRLRRKIFDRDASLIATQD